MYCYIPTKEDEQIGKLNGWTPSLAAIIRGVYDERMDKDGNPKLDESMNLSDAEQLVNAANVLREFNDDGNQRRYKHISQFHNVRTPDLRTATQHYNPENLSHRLSAISQLFRSVVFQLQQITGRSVTDICNGYYDQYGRPIAGQFAIFERLYNEVLANAEYNAGEALKLSQIPENERTDEQKAALEEHQHYAKEYTKMLHHWDELVTLTRSKLRDSMGIKLGNKVEYAEELGVDIAMEKLHFDSEESHREHWLEKQDEISAFSSMFQDVRIFLGNQIMTDEAGNLMFDDLGYPILMDPTKAHRELMDTLRGMTSSAQMEKKLLKAADTIPWIRNFYKELYRRDIDNSGLRTRLYIDFKKTFQLYGAIERRMSERQAVYKTFIVNRVKDAIKGNTKARVAKGVVLDPKFSLFTDSAAEFVVSVPDPKKKGKRKNITRKGAAINIENLNKLVGDLSSHFREHRDEHGRISTYFNDARRKMKVNFLARTFKALGIETNNKSIEKLLNNSTDTEKLIDGLNGILGRLINESKFNCFLYETEIEKDGKLIKKENPKIKKSVKTSLDLSDDWEGFTSYMEFLEDEDFAEHFDKVSTLITKYSANQEYENRALWKDANGNNITLFSDVQPSYLADKIDEVKSFVDAGDYDGLIKYVRENWGVSSYFFDKSDNNGIGRYLNRWMHELVTGGMDSDSFAKQFDFIKFIGETDKDRGTTMNFENFTNVKHILSIISEFSSLRQISKGKSRMGRFPVFILGDANVQKFITAPIYSLFKTETVGGVQRINADTQTVTYEGGREVAPIIDGLWDVFNQELIMWEIARSMKEHMNEENEAKGKPSYSEVVTYKAKTTVAKKAGEANKYSEEDGTVELGKLGVFQFLTFLNEDYESASGKREDVGKYYKMLLKDARMDDGTWDEAIVKRIIEQGMDDAFSKFMDRLVDADVLLGEQLDNVTDETRTSKYGKYTDIKSYFTQDVNMVPKTSAYGIEKTDEARLKEFLREFFWNTKFATIQQMQMFTISPIFYKDTKELQKRYKELHAPGNTLDIYAEFWNGSEYERYSEDGIETVVYFDDISLNAEKYNPEYARAVAYQNGLSTKEIRDAIKEGADIKDEKFIEKIIAAGKKTEGYKTYAHEEDVDAKDENSLTDGQGYRTFESYRKVMGMAGLWTNEMESFYRNLMELREAYGKDIPHELINKLVSEHNVVFQPIKPYMYGIEHYKFDNDVALIPVQHKYSEAVLIPELLPKDSKIRQMAEWMQDRNVDLLASSYVVKTGQWGSVDIKDKINHMDEHGNMFYDLDDALDKAAIHKFNYKDYRIQTNVPDHSNTDRLFGTQLRKLIMANLQMGKDYGSYLHGVNVNLGGNTGMVKLTGRNLLAFYNSIIVSNILDSLEDFANEVNDADKLADVLTQAIVNNSSFAMNCIDAFAMTGDSEFVMPLFEAAFEHDTASMIFSIFKNRVNRQKIKGGSAVQVSALGISKIEKDEAGNFGVDFGGLKDRTSLWNNNNVIFSEIATPFDFSVTRPDGTVENLVYEDWVDENGIPYFGVEDESGNPIEGKYGRDLTEDERTLEKEKEEGSITEEEYSRRLSVLHEEMDLCQSFVKDVKGEKHIFMPAIEVQYKNILTKIAYRIPTENDYSMLMGRIVRFTHHTAGGTMYVPAHGTSRSGWDFDIDKLYFMMFEYIEKGGDVSMITVPKKFMEKYPGSSEESLRNNYVWARWYNSHQKETDALSDARDNFFELLNDIEGDAASFNLDYTESIERLESATGLDSNDYDSGEQFIEVVKDLHSRNPYEDYKADDDSEAISVSELIELAEMDLKDAVITKDAWTNILKERLDTESFEMVKDHITDRGVDRNAFRELYKFWKLAGLEGKASAAFQEKVNEITGVRLDEYDVTKTSLENSKAARNNMLLTIIQKRLMDEETFLARNTPSAFTGASEAARNLRELTMGDYRQYGWYDEHTGTFNEDAFNNALNDKEYDPEPNYDPTDPWTIVVYNAQNQLAAKLIGIMANQNANHALATLMDELRLNEPIEFCGHSLSTDGIGADLLHKYLSEEVKSEDPLRAERIRKNVAEFLAASVDAVKDPVLNFLNLNTLTAAPGLLLARLGYSSEEIGLLFNQPIIKEICKEYFSDGFRNADNVVSKVISKYYDKKTDRDNDAEKHFGKNALRMNIIKDRIASDKGRSLMNKDVAENADFIDSQVRIGEMFSKILKASAELNSFITATKFTAANAVGTTPGAFYNQQMRIQKYLENIKDAEEFAKKLAADPNTKEKGPKTMLSMVVSGVFDESTGRVISGKVTRPVMKAENEKSDNLLQSILANKQQYIESILYNPFAYEQAMFDANRKCMELLEQYYPYGTTAYKVLRDKGNRLMSNGMLREDEINSLHQEWMVYLLSQQDHSIFNGGEMMSVTKDGKRVSNRDYYLNHFAGELFELLEENPDMKELPILGAMSFDVDVTGSVNMRILGGTSRADYSRDEIVDSWDHLSKLGKDGNELAKHLFMYCFYNHGFKYGYDNFMFMCPVSVKESIMVVEGNDETPGISYRDFLYGILHEDDRVNMRNVNMNDFYKLFIANHSQEYRWVYRPYGDALKSLTKYLTEIDPQFAEEGGKLTTVVPKGRANEGETVTSFTLDLSRFDDNADVNEFLRKDKTANAEGRYAFVPAIMIDDKLYIADGDLFNVTDGETPVMTYRLYEQLGGKGERMWYLSPSEVNNSGWKHFAEQQDYSVEEHTEGRIDGEVEMTEQVNKLSHDELVELYINTVAKYVEQEYNVRSGIRVSSPSYADTFLLSVITDLREAVSRQSTTDERIKSMLEDIENKEKQGKCVVQKVDGLWTRPC